MDEVPFEDVLKFDIDQFFSPQTKSECWNFVLWDVPNNAPIIGNFALHFDCISW